VAVRYAARVNGLDALALTKLDVLDGMERLAICTAYRCGDRLLTDFPADLQDLAACEPEYDYLPGWTESTRGIRDFGRLPPQAQRYVRALEQASGVPAAIISTGSDRDETIVRDDSVLSEWFRSGAVR
jgi:adenylosuccinate synthase